MLETKVVIKLFSLDELSDTARSKAIEDHREFMLSIIHPNDFISGDEEHDTPEELSKACEAECDYYSFEDDPIIESIEANEYLFFESGDLASTIHYSGHHPLAGEAHLVFHGEHYILENR